MITARTTRLVRVADLRAFRATLAALATAGTPFDVRDRLLVVPTRAAGAHLTRACERRCHAPVLVLPRVVTTSGLVAAFADRLPAAHARLTDAEREALLGVACRAASDAGAPPPFRLRPALVAGILRFYDDLRRNLKDVDTFERLALGALEPGAAMDRGAERLVRQTRFLAAAYRHFERLCDETGAADEHGLRALLLRTPAASPIRHVLLAVADRAADPYGLHPADWDLLARVPALERLDIVITDQRLAGAQHERLHQLLPGIDEVRGETTAGHAAAGDTDDAAAAIATAATGDTPLLVVPPGGGVVYTARDREDEVAGFARWVKRARRAGDLSDLDAAALVMRQPLPYVYISREILRAGGIPSQMFDALPLAGEPYAAALDLVLSFVAANFARVPAVALLRSPHFDFPVARDLRDVAALDRALSDAGYLGDHQALATLVAGWTTMAPARGTLARALRAAAALETAATALLPLRSPAPVASHLDVLIAFLDGHERLPGPDDPLRARQLRARSAILGLLASLRDAYRRFDGTPVEFDAVAAMVRRWIEAQTFAPRHGDAGVHIVDAESARFGDFELVQLVGLVEGEWPERPRRNIFYSPAILRDLGWTAEADRLDGVRAGFVDLLRLPSRHLRLSSFSLEADALVTTSALVEEVDHARLDQVEQEADTTAIFDHERLARLPVSGGGRRAPGMTDPAPPDALAVSAIERYQDCPFRFFAADVLRLEEAPDEEPALSPRARGRFVHEVFQRCVDAWDAEEGGPITSDRLAAARALFERVAEPLLARLPDAEAALERARLFGSAIAVGIVDVLLDLEAARPGVVTARWLEHRFDASFGLGAAGRRVRLKGVADRIDLLADRRLRVIDYKSGYPPSARRALQVPIYALCAQEELRRRGDGDWVVDEAAYVALAGRRPFVPVIRSGDAAAEQVLADARDRLFAAVDGIAGGVFPPRPHDPHDCRTCPYPSVCRKDDVGDE